MKFSEIEVVKTLIDFPIEGIRKGDIGTVVLAYSKPNEAYEVEFVNEGGTTKAVFSILPENIGKHC